ARHERCIGNLSSGAGSAATNVRFRRVEPAKPGQGSGGATSPRWSDPPGADVVGPRAQRAGSRVSGRWEAGAYAALRPAGPVGDARSKRNAGSGSRGPLGA